MNKMKGMNLNDLFMMPASTLPCLYAKISAAPWRLKIYSLSNSSQPWNNLLHSKPDLSSTTLHIKAHWDPTRLMLALV